MTPPRDDSLFNLEYGYWFNAANERFYRRVDFLTNLVQLVGGSGAAAAALGGRNGLVIASGLVLAVAAAVSLTVQAAVKAERHERAKCKYLGIKRRMHNLSDAELHEAATEAQEGGPLGIESLAMPSYNAALRAIDREGGQRPLRWSQRLAEFFA